MVETAKFDVFLAHNSTDKPQVRIIAQKLRQRGLKPWLDEEQIAPGRSFQDEIQQALPVVKSAAIFIGLTGVGRWQASEIRSLTRQSVERGIPVIPILLPRVTKIPDPLEFLKDYRWISLEGLDEEDVLYQLEWGITGVKPERNRQTVTPVRVPSPKTEEVKPKSERGYDYTKLRDLLAAGKWKEADEETAKAMLQVAGRQKEGWLRAEDIDAFPCEDLRTIDRLWVHYSKGRFGFSVQKKIYESLGGTRKYDYEVWKKFGDRVGWRKNRTLLW